MAAEVNNVGEFVFRPGRDIFEAAPPSSEALRSKRAQCLNFFKKAVEWTVPIGSESFCQNLDKEIEKLENQKKLKNSILAEEGMIFSTPSKIKKGEVLKESVTIAPNSAAVEKIKKELSANGEPEAFVEMLLQSLLQAENLSDYFYNRPELYREEKNQVTIRTYDDRGNFAADVTYAVQVIDPAPGLNAFLLIPQNTPEEVIPEVKMIFVGTKDWAGIGRDAEKGAAGNITFEAYERLLLSPLDEALGNLSSNQIKISIIGHSLGGADAQRMVSNIIRVRNEEATPYSQLKLRNMNLWLETSAAPGLTSGQCEVFARDLERATIRSEDQPMFTFNAIASIYNQDIVPTCGYQHILANPDVLSLCTQIHLIYTQLALFQHESALYCDENQVPNGGVQIFQTTGNGSDGEAMRSRITDILNRNFRINIR